MSDDAEVDLGDPVADLAAHVEDGRVGIELHRLDEILLDDADLDGEGRHGDGALPRP